MGRTFFSAACRVRVRVRLPKLTLRRNATQISWTATTKEGVGPPAVPRQRRPRRPRRADKKTQHKHQNPVASRDKDRRAAVGLGSLAPYRLQRIGGRDGQGRETKGDARDHAPCRGWLPLAWLTAEDGRGLQSAIITARQPFKKAADTRPVSLSAWAHPYFCIAEDERERERERLPHRLVR